MVLFQWHYLTVKCYVTLEFPAWAQGRPGPGCFFCIYHSKAVAPYSRWLSNVSVTQEKREECFPCTHCNFFFFFRVAQSARTKVKPQKGDLDQPLHLPAVMLQF